MGGSNVTHFSRFCNTLILGELNYGYDSGILP